MNTLYNSIQGLNDVQEIIKKSASEDGETIEFELKGASGKDKFDKELKKIISKEVCAFANTYGGVLCFHNGEDNNLKPFPAVYFKQHFNSIESWLRDSLEPRHVGIAIKVVDDVLLINVPASKTKPHRAGISSTYYFRHNTISSPMPEIMISSMYRSQEYLEIELEAHIKKTSGQYEFQITTINNSNISGSKPKILITIYSSSQQQLTLEPNNFITHDYFKSHSNHILKSEFGRVGKFATNQEFLKNLLYPQDHLRFEFIAKEFNEETFGNHLLISLDVMFLESQRKTSWMLYDFIGNVGECIYKSETATKEEIFPLYEKYILISI